MVVFVYSGWFAEQPSAQNPSADEYGDDAAEQVKSMLLHTFTLSRSSSARSACQHLSSRVEKGKFETFSEGP
jgi:hypothetical protein